MRIRDQRPIEFRQLCAIARVVFLTAPTMSDAEWKGATLDACSKQGWAYPEGDMLARALGAVERALEQTVGPRRTREAVPPPAPPKPDRVWSAVDLKQLAETVRRIQARSAGATPTNVRTIPLERWEISEPAALDEFYREAEVSRIDALKRFAEIAIARPADWDVSAIRAQAAKRRLVHNGGVCFACRRPERAMVSHHIIQIQHGGSNYVRNRVDICEACHADVHPWLEATRRDSSGWFNFSASAAAIMKLLEDIKRKRERDAS